MKNLKLIIPGLILAVIFICGCNNDEENVLPPNKGRINIHLTDAPFPIELLNSAVINIDRVEVRHRVESGMESEKDSFVVINEDQMQIDLLELTNGITEEIGSTDLEPGYYDMIRLHVVNATVTLNDGTSFDLKVPSGSSSGLKIKISPAFYLKEGQTTDVLLDFDISRSFIVKGNINGHINGFNFKPVVRAVYMGAAGRIEGTVTDTVGTPLEHAAVKVWIPDNENENEEDDLITKSGDDGEWEEGYEPVSTFTDAEGNYKLIGLPEGVFSVICQLEGYENDTIDNVEVVTGNSTTLDIELIENSDELANTGN